MKHYVVAAAIGLAGIAPLTTGPAQGATPAHTQQQKRAALDPAVRDVVDARVAKGETFDSVVELLVLNEAATRYPGAKFYKVMPAAQTVLVAMPDNTMRSVAYDPATLKLKPHAQQP